MNKLFSFVQKGDFDKTLDYLNKALNAIYELNAIDKYGQMGVDILKQSTPKDTNKTAESWYYKKEIDKHKHTIKLTFYNTNLNDGYNVAMLLQYGHGLENGTYVEGIDYINPALKPVFEGLAEEAWKEVADNESYDR